jgi:hypothetical protein
MDQILKIRELLKGRKSYLVGIASIILGLYIGGTEGHEMVIMGLGFITLKAGQTTTNEDQTKIEGEVEQ